MAEKGTVGATDTTDTVTVQLSTQAAKDLLLALSQALGTTATTKDTAAKGTTAVKGTSAVKGSTAVKGTAAPK